MSIEIMKLTWLNARSGSAKNLEFSPKIKSQEPVRFSRTNTSNMDKSNYVRMRANRKLRNIVFLYARCCQKQIVVTVDQVKNISFR